MNNSNIMGRITHDLQLKYTALQNVPYVIFTVAVPRRYDKNKQQQESDFIRCVAWYKCAEFITHYFAKGRMIAIEGRLHTRTYTDKNGMVHYITEIYVTNAEFTGEAKPQQNTSQPASNQLPQEPPANNNLACQINDDDIISEDGVPF
ncbi:single-stranded DNA-binding protein [Ruminococcus sp. Marseille-P6503]|uniref:single-stranded DNA-binding protein n=1 Tax=Ruminococcus sp. Marseille-P6503 TaxID=2364796 RepID=UPI0013DE5B5D|nr:single-stranded DNA-binding protein [Ruminococcus sp. Marseille-P6503]